MTILRQTRTLDGIIISFGSVLKQLELAFPGQCDCNRIAWCGKLTANYLYPETFWDSALDTSKGPYGIPDLLLLSTI